MVMAHKPGTGVKKGFEDAVSFHGIAPAVLLTVSHIVVAMTTLLMHSESRRFQNILRISFMVPLKKCGAYR